jgi:hypothetical protein
MRFSARQKEERGPPHLLQPRIEDIAGCEAKHPLYQRVIFPIIRRIASPAILPLLFVASGQEACFVVSKTS